MQRHSLLIGFVLAACVLFAGCGNVAPYTPPENSSSYSPTEAVRHGDVVVGPDGKVTNLSAFTRFLDHLAHHQSDKVQITYYTTEGDPIFSDLSFDGTAIQYTFDDSNDRFGGQNKGRGTTTCTGISTHRSSIRTVYLVDGCKDPNMPVQILMIPSKH